MSKPVTKEVPLETLKRWLGMVVDIQQPKITYHESPNICSQRAHEEIRSIAEALQKEIFDTLQ